ncbi:tenascin-X isoform X2 [Sminthopsis crassicaudata]|uniref:tenascin-X isoform X2 n=1 Tax=Sminthopsis crassicaudata TaxID=9301 RepID=UPI003D68C2C3
MISTRDPLVPSLVLLVLLGIAGAGPFLPRSNGTASASRFPPHPGGRITGPGGGGSTPKLYEHTVEGGEKQVVFTHRINLPSSANCGCPPGAEPPAPASEVQALRVKLEALEELVKGLKEQCHGGCCSAAAQAGTGQTDVRSLCSHHGVFDLDRCACSCEPGWAGPTCLDPISGTVTSSCPEDCNDQGRCVQGRCVCFSGYSGPSCSRPACPGDCRGRGRCVQGVCVCRTGFTGEDCGTRACPKGCSQRGQCKDGKCVCDPGYSGEDCGVRSCPRDCNQKGRCKDGKCVCEPGYSGEDCGVRSCPRDCNQQGRCEDGKCVCEPGYSGEDCGVRSCPRDCNQQGRCEDGRCVCDPGYSGEDCGVRSCSWDCGDGGRCVDGRCVCWPGYAGEDCSVRTCPRDCHGRGHCEDGECICEVGYSGDDCGVRSCPQNCNQRGHCEDGRCVCWPGYTGEDCGSRACPRNCRGRGRCENGACVCNAGYSGIDCGVRTCPGDCLGRGRCENGRCVCWPGYTGKDCGSQSCPGDCRGRGRCQDGRCICEPGYTGDDCGSRRCPGDCRGRGQCEDGVCVCDRAYTGEDCGQRSCPGDCWGRGKCQDGFCVCDAGYTGEDCGTRSCPRDCSHQGICHNGVCTCWEGYTGEDCSLRTCPGNCNHRGQCENGHCVCEVGYTGPSCATQTCPGDCQGRGRCVQGVCVCREGYHGKDCGQREFLAESCPGGCGARELCRAGRCVCIEGFEGPDCATRTCPGDCWGHGVCREGSCICHDGYGGEDCREEIPPIAGMRMRLLEETTVRTEWTRASGPVDAYEIQFTPTTEGIGRPFSARVPSSALTYDQRGLSPGQEYQVTVRALRGSNWGPPASQTITTMIDGPQDLRVTAVTPTTMELSWLRPQAEVDRFVVSYVSAGNQRVRLNVAPEEDRTLLTGLMPGVEYVVTVTAERGRAVSYPASVRASTAPAHHNYRDTHPPAPPPRPPVRPHPPPGLRPDLDPWLPQPVEEEDPKPREVPLGLPPPRFLRNLTSKLGLSWGSVQDVERYLRASGYPLRGNQTYTSVARSIYAYLQRRAGGLSAPPSSLSYKPQSTANLDPDTRKPNSARDTHGHNPDGVAQVEGSHIPLLPSLLPGPSPRHPKPEVLGSSADGALLVSLDGLRGQFDQVVLRWQPLSPMEGPSGEIAVPGATRIARLPGLRPSTTYHVEVHGVQDGQASKSYAFITTTGLTPPPTTQGAQAPLLKHPVNKPGALSVPPRLGKLQALDVSPNFVNLHWTVPEGRFDSFLVQYKDKNGKPQRVPIEGLQHSVIISPLDPDHKYKFTLYGFEGRKRHGPLTIDAKTSSFPNTGTLPRLGDLRVTDPTSDSLHLSWTVPEGQFDSFLVQYKDRDGQIQAVPVEGPERSITISSLDPSQRYKFILYGLIGKKRHGPLTAEGSTAPLDTESPKPRVGKLIVTDVTQNSLRLLWTILEGKFDSFVVQYKDKDGQPQVVPVEAGQNEVTISDLQPSRKYKMNLYGLLGKQRVGPISVIVTTDPFSAEPPLGEVTVTDVTPDSLRLSWTITKGEFDSFEIQYDKDGQPKVVSTDGIQDEVTISNLEHSRKYKFLLFGIKDGKYHGPVSVETKTAPREEKTPSLVTDALQLPTKPHLGELMVTNATSDSLQLSWTSPKGQFESFMIQYKNGDGQPKVVHVKGDKNTVIISGLEPDHKYKMNLYGFHNGQHMGPISITGITAPKEDITEPPETPFKPHLGELRVTDSTSDSLHLSWSVPEGQFDSFVIQYKNGDGQPKVKHVRGEQKEVTISGLEPDHKYKMNLYGYHNKQRVGPISVIGVTAPQDMYQIPVPTILGTEAPEPTEKPELEELTVTGATSDSLKLSWSISHGEFDSYTIQYKDRDGRPQIVRVEGDQNEITISELEPDHRYKMNLYGFHDGQRVGPVSVTGVTAPHEEETPAPTVPATEPPEQPELGDLAVTGATPDSLRLSWTVSHGEFDSFTIQYKDRDGRPQIVRVGGDQNEVTISELEPDHRYKMNLYGFHDGQRVGPVSVTGKTDPHEEETPAPTVPATEAPEPPEQPELGDLTVTGATPDSLRLSWTVSRGEFDSFTIQYKDRDGKPQIVRVGGDQNEVTISELEPDHRYKMNLYGFHDGQRVGPVSVTGKTDPHEEETPAPTVPATEAPEQPELGDLTVTGATPDSLRLSWTVSHGEFDSFTIQYKDRDGRPQIVRVGGDQNEVTISELEPDHRYKMNLYGFHDGQRVGPVSVTGKTDPHEEETPAPTVPATEAPSEQPELGDLTVTGATPDSLRLSWTVSRGEFDSFTIQYKDRDGRPQIVRVGGDQNEVTISELEPDHRYKMNLYGFHDGQRVGPVSVTGKTDPHEEETPAPTVPATEAPEQPELGDLAVTGATPDSLRLSWTVSHGEFDSFTIQYKDRDGRPQIVRVGGDQNEVTISELEPDHRYKMNLYGFHDGQRVGPVSVTGKTDPHVEETPAPTVPATEAPEPPEQPELGDLTVTGATPDSLRLSWTVSHGEFDSFTIQYKDRDGRPQIVRVGGDQNEVTISELEPDHRYKMNLYGFHDGQRVGPVSVTGKTDPHEEETPAPTVPATEAPEPPEQPELGDLTVTGATPDSLRLSWTVSRGEFDSFTIQYKDRDGRPQIVRVGGDQNEVTISELEPDHRYKMNLYGFHDGQRVGPVSVTGKTDPHEEETPAPTVPATEPPEQPELGDLTVTGATPDSLRLSWTVSHGEFDSFTIQYKDRDGRPQIVRVGGDQNEVTISELEPDHRYKMNLYGFHDGQRVGPVSVTGKTDPHEEETPAPTVPATEAPEPPEQPELGDLTVTGATPDSLRLSWTVSRGELDSFTIQYKDRDGRPQIVRVGGDQNEVTISELEPDHRYKMNLYGFHDGQRVGPVSVTGKTDPHEEETPAPTVPATEAPEQPELGDLTVTGATPDSLRLSWTVSRGEFDSFTIQYKDRDGRPQIVRVGGDQNEVTISELEPDHRYKMNLYGFHDGQRVGPVSVTGKTDPHVEETPAPTVPATEAPEQPELGDLTVTGATPDSLRLSWTVSHGEFDSFTIQYKDRDGRPQIVRVGGDQNEVTISELEPDHRYKMNLYGFHDGQRVGPVSVTGKTDPHEEETPAPTVPATEAPEPPEQPELGDLTVTGATPDSLRLSWTVSRGEFDSFTIQYKDRDGRPQIVRVGGDQNEVTISELEPDHRYKMNLYGFHDGQRVGPVSVTGKTAPDGTESPSKPSLGELTVTDIKQDSLHLNWNVLQGPFDSFVIQYKNRDGQLQVVPVAGDQNGVTVSDLEPSQKYKFLLFGLHNGKRSIPISADAKTLPAVKPAPLLGEMTVTDPTSDSLHLSWTILQGPFDSFVVQYKDKDGQLQVVPVGKDQREITISSLEPNRKYKFLLYGLFGKKRLGPISTDGTTAPKKEDTQLSPHLGEMKATDATPNSLHLSWTVSQGPFDSFLVQYKDKDGQLQVLPVIGNENEITVFGLEPKRKYMFLLYGLYDGKRVGPISAQGVTEEEAATSSAPATEIPESLMGPRLGVLKVTDVAPNSLGLSWTVLQEPFNSFVIQYKDKDRKSQAVLVRGDQKKITISNLEANRKYTFLLYGLYDGKRLGPISTEATTGLAPAGQSPGGRLSQLSVSDVTTSSFRLNWEAPPGAFDSFLLRYGIPEIKPSEPLYSPLLQRELTVPGIRRTAIIRDLRPGTLYAVTLYGLRGPHKADSLQGTARTLSPVLESPRDLKFSEIQENSAKVSWTPPPNQVDSFKISYQLADGGEPQSVQVDSHTWHQHLVGLTPGAQYEVTVLSVRGFEESEPLTGFLITVPDGPTHLQALNVTDDSALLHWSPPQAPVDRYALRITAPEVPPVMTSVPGGALDFSLHNLQIRTNYTVTLRGFRGPNITSPASITFTTGLDAPHDLKAKEVTPRSALLTWTEPESPPTGYLLSYNTPGEQTKEILLPGGVTSHQLSGLFPSTLYNAWIQAIRGQSLTPPVPTTFTTGGLRIPFPRDCGEEVQNGLSHSHKTTIFLNGNRERPLEVYCDMETDGGGWLVFQRRMDGHTDFWRDWAEYAHGFGNISGEFWLGNEALHSLTQAGDYSLRVDLRAGNESVFAEYDFFTVDSAAKYYRLHLEGYHGTAGDSMSYHSGSMFSTRDRDPSNLHIPCAVSYRGGWWYRNCHYANLNGLYGSIIDHQGVSWYAWKGFEFSIPFTEMKLRPRSYNPSSQRA